MKQSKLRVAAKWHGTHFGFSLIVRYINTTARTALGNTKKSRGRLLRLAAFAEALNICLLPLLDYGRQPEVKPCSKMRVE